METASAPARRRWDAEFIDHDYTVAWVWPGSVRQAAVDVTAYRRALFISS